MADIFPPIVQRPALLKLERVLQSRHKAMRRDGCMDWMISGKHGKIYAVPSGFLVCCDTEAARQWSAVKAAIGGFCRITQDGDTEGNAMLDRLPTPVEAVVLRRVLGIAKHRQVSDETRERLSRMSFGTVPQNAVEAGFAA